MVHPIKLYMMCHPVCTHQLHKLNIGNLAKFLSCQVQGITSFCQTSPHSQQTALLLHHIVNKLPFCFRKLYPTASRNLRIVVQFHHTACCPLVFRISVAQFYHTSYCPLVFRISVGQFHHTQHTALWFSVSHDSCPISPHTAYCPIALWFSESHDSCPISPHTHSILLLGFQNLRT